MNAHPDRVRTTTYIRNNHVGVLAGAHLTLTSYRLGLSQLILHVRHSASFERWDSHAPACAVMLGDPSDDPSQWTLLPPSLTITAAVVHLITTSWPKWSHLVAKEVVIDTSDIASKATLAEAADEALILDWFGRTSDPDQT